MYKVFENVAQKYDVMNDAMSFGIHRLWKDTLLHVMNPQPGAQLLDMAGGTGKTLCTRHWIQTLNYSDGGLPPPAGDIAFRFLQYVRSQQEKQKQRRRATGSSTHDPDADSSAGKEDGPAESRAVVCDINKEMLNVGKQKADSMGVRAGLIFNLFLGPCVISSAKLLLNLNI